jgi:Na+/proline symporter/signal transduction histidine kinase
MRELAAIAAVTCYIGLLFVLAIWVERSARGGKVASTALVYALAQAVYCTTWTYYGSVGYAVSSGLLFLTVYLGPTLAFVFAGTVIRKLVRIKARHGITSIADFISARYGKSQLLGALVTLIVVLGLVPYLSLQIKQMILTTALMTDPGHPASFSATYPGIGRVIGPVMVVLMVLFTIVFGIRRLRPTERHPGMMVALVAECLVKLVGFLAAGVFVVFFLFDGFGDVFDQLAHLPAQFGPGKDRLIPSAATWFSHLLLSAAAIITLPRQFHVAVVESSNEAHVRTAQWLLPLYFLAICLFVLPISVAGVASGLPQADADSFVLALPIASERRWLSWLVFLGGFSAGAGMVMIETMTISTMISNHWLIPVVASVRRLSFLRRFIRPVRWAAAAAVIGAAFAYERAFGWRYGIVHTGLVSFAAAFQFAPAIIGGLYWKRASKRGAMLGLTAGFVVWFYTLIVPILVRERFLPTSLLEVGPAGLGWLRPESLLGVGTFDSLTHATLATLFVNVGLYVLGSLLWPATESERRVARDMVDVLRPSQTPYTSHRPEALIEAGPKRRQAEQLLETYFGEAAARGFIDEAGAAAGIQGDRLTILQLAQLEAEVEKILASSIGTASAHVAIKRGGLIDAAEAVELGSAYAEILAELKVAPSELRRKVDYHEDRARQLAREAETFRGLADASRLLASSLEYQTTARTAVRTPIPWLAPEALLYLTDPLPGHEPRYFLVGSVDPDQERQANQYLALERDPRLFPAVERALRTSEADLVTIAGPPRWPSVLAGSECTLWLTLPLLTRWTPLGTLTLLSEGGGPLRHPAGLAVARELAYRCAVALDNAILFHRTQEAVRVRDDFFAVASHELKTPLTPLTLQVETLHRLLSRGDVTDSPLGKMEGLLCRSEAQLLRLNRLIDSLLDVSRITRGRLRLQCERADLSALVESAASVLQEALESAGCRLELQLAQGVVGTWDRLRLEQVVCNLLSNAMKYAPGHPIELRTSAGQGLAVLSVRDEGPGISAADRERIFQPFERAVSYLEASGFGLGLYIVRQVVEAHGGRVELRSMLGRGSTFTVELPLQPPPVMTSGAAS